MQRIPDEIHMQRAPQMMLPTRVAIGVKTALGLPVFALVRYPIPGGTFAYKHKRFA